MRQIGKGAGRRGEPTTNVFLVAPLWALARPLGVSRSPGAGCSPWMFSPCCTSQHGDKSGTGCFCGCGRCLCCLWILPPVHIFPLATAILSQSAPGELRLGTAWRPLLFLKAREGCFQRPWPAPSLVRSMSAEGLICPAVWRTIHGLKLDQTTITGNDPPLGVLRARKTSQGLALSQPARTETRTVSRVRGTLSARK